MPWHALGVEEVPTDMNIENIPAMETPLAYTLKFVTVEKSSSTVPLIHYSLQEYRSHNPNLFINLHSMTAEVRLTYHNFGLVNPINPPFNFLSWKLLSTLCSPVLFSLKYNPHICRG